MRVCDEVLRTICRRLSAAADIQIAAADDGGRQRLAFRHPAIVDVGAHHGGVDEHCVRVRKVCKRASPAGQPSTRLRGGSQCVPPRGPSAATAGNGGKEGNVVDPADHRFRRRSRPDRLEPTAHSQPSSPADRARVREQARACAAKSGATACGPLRRRPRWRAARCGCGNRLEGIQAEREGTGGIETTATGR